MQLTSNMFATLLWLTLGAVPSAPPPAPAPMVSPEITDPFAPPAAKPRIPPGEVRSANPPLQQPFAPRHHNRQTSTARTIRSPFDA